MKSAGAGDAAHAAEMADAKFEAMAHQEEGQLTEEQVQTTIERTLGDINKIVLDEATGGQGVLPYLPLNELRGGRGGPSGGQTTEGGSN